MNFLISKWERSVGEIWREILCAEIIPPSDVNFFDAGGTSIALLRLRALLKQRLDVDIRGPDLFRYTTIASLASFLAESTKS